MCIDYRKLNIQDILDKLGNARYYSALDCASGYWQIALREQDKPKTAFNVLGNHYEFNRMSFGVKSASATYQRMMNTVLCNMLGTRSFVYLDDVIVFGRTLKEHNEQLGEIFQVMRKHHIQLEPDKCEFLKPQLKYLGHVITPEGISPDSDKVRVIQDLPAPQNVTQLVILKCTDYYRTFMPNYSVFSAILTQLLKKTYNGVGKNNMKKHFRN